MGVLGAVVEESVLRHLVDEEPGEDAEDDTLVQRVADHIESFVIDAMQLLHTLQIVLLGGRVSDRPKAQVLHVSKHGPAVFEGNSDALLLDLAMAVLEARHADVVLVGDGLAQVLAS